MARKVGSGARRKSSARDDRMIILNSLSTRTGPLRRDADKDGTGGTFAHTEYR
jgi:hypothetical protein